MSVAEHIAALDESGRALADAAAAAGLDAPVPTCPGWQVRDLLRHTTMVHRWAARFVAEGHTSYRPDGGEPQLDGEERLAHFHEGHAALVEALTKAPADLECWTFLPAPSPLAFWARRQAHETGVHRADAESALPSGPRPVDATLAVDGIDELLRAFHARDRSRVRTETTRVLRVRTTDTGDVWTVRLSPDAPRTTRTDDGPADCTLSGPAWQLRLMLWNRLPADAVDIAGDASLAALWRERSGITWS
ncbi:maleylpyruvate isomerase family mycothiol-dependent enzyme [Streptomyces solicathayae]|uniref:Maleylpyruvate isomerase family mycothiol-dependent enzyme n=1 Tax=Streptomyces solicathayae TaxID=3081768 RepID=A0ABZ0M2S2_9ACTN|nr:maleylpyruvate isomerase family mycothiol-dependent enzyme [Streptomyces sp. HUAS YS2]WOX25935.1 maleylpyruvate isomerase family mycothiol-dependent enzyme [Streptomyces sp. HUAS YS2]